MKKNILIVTDSTIIKEGLTSLLSHSQQYTVVAGLDNLKWIQESMVRYKASVIIVDPLLIDYSKRDNFKSFSLTEKNKGEAKEEIAVIALVNHFIQRTYLKNFDGFIEITDTPKHIESVINSIISKPNKNKSKQRTDNGELSEREREVLALVAKGLSNKLIANQLNISTNTVISHRKNIITKTGIKSVAGLTIYALMNNLINKEDVF